MWLMTVLEKSTQDSVDIPIKKTPILLTPLNYKKIFTLFTLLIEITIKILLDIMDKDIYSVGI